MSSQSIKELQKEFRRLVSHDAGESDDNDASDDEENDSLVVGIDFGTTYSGVAWATRVDFTNNNVNFISSWPGNNRDESKVPTELWYNDDNELEWGYDISADVEPFRWFKLLLLRPLDLSPELRQSSYMTRARALMQKFGKTPVDLISDYLRALWEHTMSTIERARGDSVVEALPIHVVITIPAIWKGYARKAMEDSAKKAGILDPRLAGATKLSFAPEPEAAALSTLLEQGGGIKRGNIYIICDAGGGTVDLISYKVKSTKPIVLQEAVEGTGGLCGGIFIDQAFERICSSRLGTKWGCLTKRGAREIMKDQWEYGVKPQFRPGRKGKEHIISLPAEMCTNGARDLNDTRRKPHIKNGRIHFTDQNIANVFSDVFTDITDLVNGQIQKATKMGLSITGLILVGGLGASPYLYDHLKAVYSKVGVTVLQSGGVKPRTAICRGAVIKGFLEEPKPDDAQAPIMIASTVARASYGVMFQTPFNPLRHLLKDKIWDENEETWMASNQMKWYLKRGQLVSKIEPVRASWWSNWREEEFNGSLIIQLLQCDEEMPPTRRDLSVKELGILHCVLDVRYSDLPNLGTKKGVKQLTCEIEMVPSGASVEFSVYIDGRKQGRRSVEMRLE
ncbi:hypothetical protein F5Y07DRAFT_403302 [Xylaria sp. FL0933]|nr:hypothetical protein F5Y07DRAFT_403302 [Xylaria sp. FL0933]